MSGLLKLLYKPSKLPQVAAKKLLFNDTIFRNPEFRFHADR
jgi:hypothetical protein